MEEKILYFGFGANRDPRMMVAITGNENLVGRPGVLIGYKLCVQRLDQIPDPARTKIRASGWLDTFESYTIREALEGEVHGIIWELTPQERELVRDWELIDFGWQRDIYTVAFTEDGQALDIQTEGLRKGQEIDREVDGENYETWLEPPEDFERIAIKAREEYFARQKEGSSMRLERQG